MGKLGRRPFFRTGIWGLIGLHAVGLSDRSNCRAAEEASTDHPGGTPPSFKLGLVTYELAKDWDIETIIKNCEATGFEAVELRTTHKHGVEISISKVRRAEVKKRFEDSSVRLLSLGTTCEYQSADPTVVEKNIEETRRWCELAHDLGCIGVKVRPNGFPVGVPQEKTLEQIGRALSKCGDVARDHAVEVWLEVHGAGTQLPTNIHRIMEVCHHPTVGVCWNSNKTDVMSGSVKEAFDLLKPWLRNCHINELWRMLPPWLTSMGSRSETARLTDPVRNDVYPWHELFALLRRAGYDRYTLAEIPESCEPIRLMNYYRALWEYHAT